MRSDIERKLELAMTIVLLVLSVCTVIITAWRIYNIVKQLRSGLGRRS